MVYYLYPEKENKFYTLKYFIDDKEEFTVSVNDFGNTI